MKAKLKTSAADWCFWRPNYDPAEYYRRIKDAGIEAVEMVPPERRQAARACGLRLLTLVGPGMSAGLNRRENHLELLRGIRAVIAEADRDEVPFVIVFSGNRQGQSHAEGIAQCAEGLTALAPAARAAGVTLLLELLNSYDHADYAADHTGYAVEVIRAVASPNVKILYDCYHMARMGEDVARDLRLYLPLIGHIHVAEPPDRSVLRADSSLGWASLVREAAAGYDGYWGLEFCRRDGDALDDIPAAIKTLVAT